MLLVGIALAARLSHRFRNPPACYVVPLEFHAVIVESDWLVLNSAYISSTACAMLSEAAIAIPSIIAGRVR